MTSLQINLNFHESLLILEVSWVGFSFAVAVDCSGSVSGERSLEFFSFSSLFFIDDSTGQLSAALSFFFFHLFLFLSD